MNDHEPPGRGPKAPLGTERDPVGAFPDPAVAEFSVFYRAHLARLIGFLVWLGARSHIAAELAQETMIDVHRSWSSIEHPYAWARRAASRKLIRHLSRVEEEPMGEIPETGALLVSADALADWEHEQELLVLLGDLPPRQRQVLAWYVSGCSPAQIAEELGLKPAAVRASLMKARHAAARFLAREDDA